MPVNPLKDREAVKCGLILLQHDQIDLLMWFTKKQKVQQLMFKKKQPFLAKSICQKPGIHTLLLSKNLKKKSYSVFYY